jgi:hypothetical protein
MPRGELSLSITSAVMLRKKSVLAAQPLGCQVRLLKRGTGEIASGSRRAGDHAGGPAGERPVPVPLTSLPPRRRLDEFANPRLV